MLMALRDEPARAAEEALPLRAPATLGERYTAIRAATRALAADLSPDDCQVQSMPDCSPVKWHLAHVSWFFETFVLQPHCKGYRVFQPEFAELFNSYYHGVGPQHPRAQRHLLTRPTLAEVLAYGVYVDAAMVPLLEGNGGDVPARIELGLQHEQQHQELILTDIKHALWHHPQRPAYCEGALPTLGRADPPRWLARPGVMVEIGHAGGGFAFDHEQPRHREWLEAHALASRPVINREYREFIRDGGYARAELWLADGWDRVQAEQWQRPLYWSEDLEQAFTLRGMQPLDSEEPVCHLSYYEADAFARWAGARLPREAEWEAAAAAWPVVGNFVESRAYVPREAGNGNPGFFGNVWEWTASPYVAYPGFRPAAGVLGEYNGKFMCNQWVLRGGSCVSPASHLRASYRNFFPPHARWQFSGVRLAKDLA